MGIFDFLKKSKAASKPSAPVTKAAGEPSAPSTKAPETSAAVTLPGSAAPCDWAESAGDILNAIKNTWGVTVKPYRISEQDARALERQCPMAGDLRFEQAQYAVEQSKNSVFWHEYGAWNDFGYAKFLYKGRLYYINVSPTMKLTQSMYDRLGDLNNMAKILICLAHKAGVDREQLVLVLDGELTDQK